MSSQEINFPVISWQQLTHVGFSPESVFRWTFLCEKLFIIVDRSETDIVINQPALWLNSMSGILLFKQANWQVSLGAWHYPQKQGETCCASAEDSGGKWDFCLWSWVGSVSENRICLLRGGAMLQSEAWQEACSSLWCGWQRGGLLPSEPFSTLRRWCPLTSGGDRGWQLLGLLGPDH